MLILLSVAELLKKNPTHSTKPLPCLGGANAHAEVAVSIVSWCVGCSDDLGCNRICQSISRTYAHTASAATSCVHLCSPNPSSASSRNSSSNQCKDVNLQQVAEAPSIFTGKAHQEVISCPAADLARLLLSVLTTELTVTDPSQPEQSCPPDQSWGIEQCLSS